ncbi:N-methyl-D-aspartate receptor NMDAR2C subunit [Candidatus Pacearchaeota archaeon]|nr:N-methyl-D-aspartate receptor NMDAR2C subunit [Candidatus Pacearchaeota archaeon]
MKTRFLDLAGRIKLLTPEKKFEELKNSYFVPLRQYHNHNHVMECLKDFDRVKKHTQSPDLLEFAIFYHDAIYNTRSKTNEEDSANMALRHLSQSGLEFYEIETVDNLILATKHVQTPRDMSSKLIVDIDLAILGKDQETFDRYEWGIRHEYSWVSPNDFKIGRAQILQGFLDRDHIYNTQFFQGLYEAQAQENLKRSITKLAA